MNATIRHGVAAALLAPLACGPALAETWDMPTPYGDGIFLTQNVRQFAQDVSDATDGALEITVHSAQSLFPHEEIKNAIRSRQVPIGEIFLSRLNNEDLAYGVDSQPFLATSYDEAWNLWQAQKPVITDMLAEEGLKPLFAVAWPAQGLYTNGEIGSIDQMSGLRFRAYNAQLEEFAQLAGAAPVQVEAVDIPQAFTTGQVEAMITSPSTGADSKAWDFVTHYSPINAWIPKNIVLVNQRVFDGLPEDQQQAVLDAAAAAEERGWDMSRQEAEEKTQILRDNGITVYEPSPELVEGLKAIGDRMLDTWQSQAGDEAQQILSDYRGQ
ncbi:putative DctP (periplasmic C4-dicarboxylate binding protein) [Oceaniovalibus guishaninsula JLT2003]|uniref:Putative DctP (Periplasmic C4-dicarboxylate binding protein) n=1 Tax=Oceaniovalibus guishaninsula JLT2003 TaxID=1231392 RepID=K2GNV3_9RHOB|nr:TRAP transporter substrate-binding protein [Oceaniovalibus guishaninsula]EKE44361.1 putative DctP (periplasmic C4-dicarboxylate binding protein) [Oceaniovalibus guishaninsula JLT2003]